MSRVDPTRNVRHAIRQLLPPRPAMLENRRLVRFFSTALLSLAVVVLVSFFLQTMHAPRLAQGVLPALWLLGFVIGVPMVFVLRARDGDMLRQRVGEWESDPRRQSIERFGLDLAAGRLPEGLPPQDLMTLEATAADWRLVREALDAMSWAHGPLAEIRGQLRVQVDEAMANLLAEFGAGSPLGLSPFLLERAKSLFGEIAGEAAALSRLQARRFDLPTDNSLESLRHSLQRLREARIAQQEMTEIPPSVMRDQAR